MVAVETGFTVEDRHFYGRNAVKVEGALSVEDALDRSGLNWDVEKAPAYHQVGDDFVVAPGKFVTRRTDTQEYLGMVGNVYQPFQNRQAFAFADKLLAYGAEFESAGGYGANIFLSAKLPQGITVAGEDDLGLRLLMLNSHDGSGTIAGYLIPFRFSCTNQTRLAVAKAVSSFKIRHTATADQRVKQAGEAMNLVTAYSLELENAIAQLQATEMDLEQVTGFFEELTNADRVRANLLTTYQASPTVARGNAWGLINSVTETLQHRPARITGEASRFDSNLDGPNQRVVERATRMLINR